MHRSSLLYIFLLSAFLQNCFLCWDRWNNDVTPTLDATLLCSSRAGSDLVVSLDWFEELKPLQRHLSYTIATYTMDPRPNHAKKEWQLQKNINLFILPRQDLKLSLLGTRRLAYQWSNSTPFFLYFIFFLSTDLICSEMRKNNKTNYRFISPCWHDQTKYE